MKKKSDDKQNESVLSQVKEMVKDTNQVHKEEVDRILKETYNSDDNRDKLRRYGEQKKMKWWTYLISLAIGLVLTAISVSLWFGVGKLATAYYDFGTLLGLIIIIMGANFFKNRNAAKHFNDKRRRYQRTLGDDEAKVFLFIKTVFLGLLLFLPVVITFATMGI